MIQKTVFMRNWSRVLIIFLYQMKIMLGNFNAKVGRGNIFKPTNGKESLQQDSNHNGERTVN
jgi:hypothetical protein